MKVGQTLLNKPIYSLSDGRLLGVVKDLYFDSNLTTITGLHLGGEGFFKFGASKLIKAEAINQFGADVIFVTHSDVVTSPEQVGAATSWVRREELKGREVSSPSATKVGKIGDVMLDDHGQVLSFSLSEIYITGPIAMQQSIRRDVVINAGDNYNPMMIDLVKAGQPSLL